MEQLVRVKETYDDGTALVFRIRESACVHVHPYGAISVGQKGEQLADLDAMVPEVIAFSDDGKGVQSESLMREAMEQCRRLGELVKVESETAPVLKAAAVLYVVPLVLFFSGYYLGFRLGGFGALVGGLGFVLGIALVLVYDRKVARKANIDYTITAFARKI